MTESELIQRTKLFSVGVIKLCNDIPNTNSGQIISRQIIRSAASVGANYRAACRAKSKKDFIYKLNIVLEECDETMYWLELLEETFTLKSAETKEMYNEGKELMAILTASILTSKRNLEKSKI